MEIKQEQFDKLKQLDRIEYRQTLLQIVNKSLTYLILEVMCLFSSSILFLLELYFLSFIMFLVGTIFFIRLITFPLKPIKKLNEKYFKVEVNK